MATTYKSIIEPGSQAGNYWRDLWNYRGLFFFLAWRDVLVRYKQTFIGASWSVLRPLFYILAFVMFRKAFGQNEANMVLSVAAAILPWQFFSTSFSDISNSLVANSNLLSKVYFPRILVPASSMVVCLIDFLVSFVLVIIIMIWQQYVPPVQFLFLPFFLLAAILASFGTGLLVASLNVKYRDFRFIIPFIVQVGLFVSPIAFSSASVIYSNESVALWMKVMYSLNPMVAVIDGFKWCILGSTETLNSMGFLISFSSSIVFLWLGVFYFRKTERSFADVI
ncbi:MAG: ABC transporter permease [Cytophagaceae bacterium]|jgi:lipopolysaccharide transport system permease protein|nr:ABC transporter permease [Cytophagaceae bacterium]